MCVTFWLCDYFYRYTNEFPGLLPGFFVDTKIMFLAFIDPILARLDQNDTCLCDFVIVWF